MKQPISELMKYPRYWWERYFSMTKKDRAFRVMYRECNHSQNDLLAVLLTTPEGDPKRKVAEDAFYIAQDTAIDKYTEAIK